MPDALERLDALVERYRTRGVLLDADLLVLYVVGRHDLRLLAHGRHTKRFGRRDFEFVAGLVAACGRLVTTPHVLTEVNGLSNTGVPGRFRWEYLRTFRQRIGEMAEAITPATEIATAPEFLRVGLTDAAVLALAEDGPLVVSADLDLCVALESRGLDVINYNHIQFLA